VHRNQTEHRNIIGCRWVLKIQYGPQGEVQQYKARLVTKGYTQSYGIDSLQTFSEVVMFQTLCLLLVLATFKDFAIHQIDIKAAYHGEDLSSNDRSRYMWLCPGISRGPLEEEVLQLQKTLYG
jgi:hypothetical protein